MLVFTVLLTGNGKLGVALRYAKVEARPPTPIELAQTPGKMLQMIATGATNLPNMTLAVRLFIGFYLNYCAERYKVHVY